MFKISSLLTMQKLSAIPLVDTVFKDLLSFVGQEEEKSLKIDRLFFWLFSFFPTSLITCRVIGKFI